MSAGSQSSGNKTLDENQATAGNLLTNVADWGAAVDHHNQSSA